MKRVIGLDSLRFVMAFIVLLGHGAIPSFSDSLIEQYKIIYLLDLGLKFIQPSGIAAVMAFFILSGFVIHYPYTDGKTLNIPEFYAKRFLRILIPGFIATVIYYICFGSMLGVIWSLICELIYYLLYPLIYKYKDRFLLLFTSISFLLSYSVSIIYSLYSTEYNGDFHRTGYFFTWIVGLPVWLLGVILAEQYKRKIANKETNIKYYKLWLWRIGVYFAASFCLLLRFHMNIAYSFTLPIYALLLYFWIKNEISFYQNRTEYQLLEYGGLMSYSIYLIHAHIISLLIYINGGNTITSNWLLCLFAIIGSLLASWIFYIIIEKPSHKLARSIRIKM